MQRQFEQLSCVEIGPEIYALPVKSLHRSCRSVQEASDRNTKAGTKMGVLCGHHTDVLWSFDGFTAFPVSGR